MLTNDLVIDLLHIAEEYNVEDEINVTIAENYIKKYTSALKIDSEMVDVIKKRFELSCCDARAVKKIYNNVISAFL